MNGEFSGWTDVTRGVPQGSVLGAILSSLSVDKLDQGIDGITSKFADDLKLMEVIGNECDRELLQTNLNKIAAWANEWSMTFSVDKCMVAHFGSNNPRFSYELNGVSSIGWFDSGPPSTLGKYISRFDIL